jgi:hypothetical protein
MTRINGVATTAERKERHVARAVAALAARETTLLIRHPVHIFGLFYAAAFIVAPYSGAAWFLFDGEGGSLCAWYGFTVYLAANLCRSRACRTGAQEWLEVMPIHDGYRLIASCLATLGPFVIGCVVLFNSKQLIGERPNQVYDTSAPALLGYALVVLGAGLFGVAVGAWIRSPGIAVLIAIGIFAVSITPTDTSRALLSPFVSWIDWQHGGDILRQGSRQWHAGYILGLAGMAACCAVGRYRPWFRVSCIAGAIVAGLTLTAAFAQ